MRGCERCDPCEGERALRSLRQFMRRRLDCAADCAPHSQTTRSGSRVVHLRQDRLVCNTPCSARSYLHSTRASCAHASQRCPAVRAPTPRSGAAPRSAAAHNDGAPTPQTTDRRLACWPPHGHRTTIPLLPGKRPCRNAASTSTVSAGNVDRSASRCSDNTLRLCLERPTTSTSRSTPLSRYFVSQRRCSAWRSWSFVSASTPTDPGPSSCTSHARRSPGRPMGASLRQRNVGASRERKRSRRRSWPASRTGEPSG